MARESYCGLCDDCQLGNPNFLETVSELKAYVKSFRANLWVHCFPTGDRFNFDEFRKGLDWFLTHTDCPGCKGGRGLEDCPIRACARARHLEHCYLCLDLEPCNKFDFLLPDFPDLKTRLRRRQLKFKARQYHQRLHDLRK